MKRLAPAILLAVLLCAPAVAQAPVFTVTAANGPRGYVGLEVQGPPGAAVAVVETGGSPHPVGTATLDASGRAALPRAAAWRCSPRTRRFHADGLTPDGVQFAADASVRTPSCAKRFEVAVRPARPRAGRPVTVAVRDGFGLGGLSARVCARGPAGLERCTRLRLREGRARGAGRLRLPRVGRWRVGVEIAGRRRGLERIAVRRAAGHLSLLATGDSMIQVIDGFLRSRLQPDHVGVRSDARISTGLSKSSMFDWPRHARAQARSRHPDVTVMFIGANDGFPIGSAQCCGDAWVKGYARRASAMMATYARHGAGTVYWNLLPAPRAGNFRRVFVAVNRALRLADRHHPGAVRLVDLPAVFTPGYRFRQSIRWHGRTVSVRQADGVHLNAAGASIAATVIIRRMRRDGVI